MSIVLTIFVIVLLIAAVLFFSKKIAAKEIAVEAKVSADVADVKAAANSVAKVL